ncbi:hypothetical protein GpartN1_g5925.t1 [Galdieria partita]|uniref:Ribosomal protein eL8/eL30/eS12/Gadd45 domain-containing protein n=1 Tax=Galdieria partita TaxID=83374 RepID=A0A9C7Q1I5_9RHOD|nr:hypothetical protein GpartN1_g5925.t1 [Galdieria partita]
MMDDESNVVRVKEKVPSKTLLKQSKSLKEDTASWNPKKVFRSSFFPRWPQLEANEEKQVVGLLEEAFAVPFASKRRKRKRSFSAASNESSCDILVFGFNQVTRMAERGELEAIFVTRDVEPDILIQHFPWLCTFHDILLFPMQSSSMQRIRGIFALRSLLVMGLRRSMSDRYCSLQGQYSLTEFMDRLKALAPCLPHS